MPYIRLPDGTWKKVNDGAPVDSTLKISGAAADAKAVGTALAETVKHNAVQELTDAQKVQARTNIGAGEPQVQTDWNQNDETAVDFIKNRTHYEIPDVWEKVEFTEPLIKEVSTTMFVSEEYTWSADKAHRVRVDGIEYVFDGMTHHGLSNIFGGKEVYSIGAPYAAWNSNINWAEYPFSFATADFTNIYAVFEDGTTDHTVELFISNGEIKQLDQKFVPNADWSVNDADAAGYVKNRTHYEIPEVVTTLRFDEDWNLDSYPWKIDNAYTLRIDGIIYRFDGFEYGFYHGATGYDFWYLGTKPGYISGSNQAPENWDESPYPFSIYGPIYYGTNDLRYAHIHFKDGTTNHTVEIIEKEKNIKYLDAKFIKDMYYERKVTVFEEQTISGFAVMNDPLYEVEMENILSPEEGKECTIEWDGVAYDVVWKTHPEVPLIYAGNENYVNMTSGGDIPFAIVVELTDNLMFFVTESTAESHTVCVKELGIHYIDPKYIKDMYYDNGVAITEVVPETTVKIGQDFPTELNLANITVGNTYIVTWNGEFYECVCYQFMGAKVIGNVNGFDGVGGNGEPFCIVNLGGVTRMMALEAGTYTISITEYAHDIKQLDTKYLPIIKENKEVVFEMDDVENDTEYCDESFKTLLGKYSITVDDKLYTLFFNAIEDISLAENEIIYIETWNGGIYISFADGETHSVKIKKIIEVIDDKYLPQSDWNQNDETAADYIKNRTHYEYEKLTPLKDPITVDCNNSAYTYGGSIECYVNTGAYAYWLGGWPSLVGQTIKIIFDGKPYDVPISEDRGMSSLTSYPFEISETTDRFFVYALEPGTHTLEFYSIDDYELKQLDEKFIPDTIARTVNFINGIKLTDTVTGLKYLVQIQDGTLVTTLSIEDLLIDFDYTTNENGTYTLTNWKQTLNGEESTELIIPEYPKIIL